MTKKHIVSFSGGIGSWMAARRVKEKYGSDDMLLLFTDTLIEDEDLYRFLDEAAEDIGAPLVCISEGRTPWKVFFDEKLMGNSQKDPCSRILKRELADAWISERFSPEDCEVYLGIDWTEVHRIERTAQKKLPYRYHAPMVAPPYFTKKQMMDESRRCGIEPPRLYAMGFQHNNCGGFCIKSGQASFKLLLENFPERYLKHEQLEQDFREKVGKNVSIMRDRRGGTTKPMTMRDFRERVQGGAQVDMFDYGGCGCFLD